MTLWLSVDPPSWASLIQALKMIDQNGIAHDIETGEFITLKLSSQPICRPGYRARTYDSYTPALYAPFSSTYLNRK